MLHTKGGKLQASLIYEYSLKFLQKKKNLIWHSIYQIGYISGTQDWLNI
jgi:hypothetical protein